MIMCFVYGANLDLSGFKKIGLQYELITKATLKDWKLVFEVINPEQEGVSYVNIIPSDGSIVEGVIIKIDKSNRIKMDKHERVPELYVRDKIIVETNKGEQITCMTYFANPFNVEGGLRPTTEHLNMILLGTPFFSQNYLKCLNNVETFD